MVKISIPWFQFCPHLTTNHVIFVPVIHFFLVTMLQKWEWLRAQDDCSDKFSCMSLTPSDTHPVGTALGVPEPQLLDWHPPYPKKTPNQPKNKNKTQTNKKLSSTLVGADTSTQRLWNIRNTWKQALQLEIPSRQCYLNIAAHFISLLKALSKSAVVGLENWSMLFR